MMQNIVELKMKKWIPGEDNSDHETQDQKVETIHLDTEDDDSLMANSSNVFTDASTTLTEYELMSQPMNTTPETNRKRKRESLTQLVCIATNNNITIVTSIICYMLK